MVVVMVGVGVDRLGRLYLREERGCGWGGSMIVRMQSTHVSYLGEMALLNSPFFLVPYFTKRVDSLLHSGYECTILSMK
jgi:hypothetical protein